VARRIVGEAESRTDLAWLALLVRLVWLDWVDLVG
jgi:hypothetical protein